LIFVHYQTCDGFQFHSPETARAQEGGGALCAPAHASTLLLPAHPLGVTQRPQGRSPHPSTWWGRRALHARARAERPTVPRATPPPPRQGYFPSSPGTENMETDEMKRRADHSQKGMKAFAQEGGSVKPPPRRAGREGAGLHHRLPLPRPPQPHPTRMQRKRLDNIPHVSEEMVPFALSPE
jgi:hypothetical protein